MWEWWHVFILSIIFVIIFVGFYSKPSPIYGGLSLIVGGGVGCGVVIKLGGYFLGLVVFLVYLGGMFVVFGYMAAMAIEEYPEFWVSNAVVFSTFIASVVMEMFLVFYMLDNEELSIIFEFMVSVTESYMMLEILDVLVKSL